MKQPDFLRSSRANTLKSTKSDIRSTKLVHNYFSDIWEWGEAERSSSKKKMWRQTL